MTKYIVLIFLATSKLFAHELEIQIEEITELKGTMAIAIHLDKSTYLSHEKEPYKVFKLPVLDKLIFTKVELPKGNYAITIFHDLNNNNKLDVNVLGIPTEAIGFSNNSRIIFGPPKFENSLFDLSADKKISIKLKNIL